MAGRTTGNKRQREMLRKERQAEKLTRRDERRTKRVAGDSAEILSAVADQPSEEPVSVNEHEAARESVPLASAEPVPLAPSQSAK